MKGKRKLIQVNQSKSKYDFEVAGVPVYMPYAPYEGQKMFIQYIIENLKEGKNSLVQSPTGTGKTLSLLCSTLSWLKFDEKSGKKSQKQRKRIIYTSRTHAQLKQVIQQLVRSGFDVNLSIMASRDHTCLNSDLKELSGQSKQLECRLRTVKKNGLFCNEIIQHEEYFQKIQKMGEIADLQDLGKKGKAQGFCPFFYSKHSKNIAHLILMPYNYLFDESAHRKNDEVSNLVKNSIIIFDEGHNIPSVSEQSKEFTITLTTIEKALHQLSDVRQERLGQNTKKTKQEVFQTTVNDIQEHASFVEQVYSFFQTYDLPNDENGLLMNGFTLFQSLQNGSKNKQKGSLSKKLQKLMNSIVSLQSDIKYRPFWSINSWITFLTKLYEISKKIKTDKFEQHDDCKCQLSYYGSDIKISFICVDPKSGFEVITRMNPYSIILTSGTLSPLNSFPMQLQTEFAKPLACPHIIKNEQVNGCILTHGPSKNKLNFCYENRENKELYKDLGQIICSVSARTPNGMIVFVSSYVMLEKVRLELTNNGFLSQIYSHKIVFFEKKNSSDFKVTLDSFCKEAVKGKGALLFALSRGKISEGLDFSDEKCRAVIMVGVPYPASRDLKIMTKMAYLDQKSKMKKSMNGNQWYICETIRCINQSIGRIVRNKADFGSIYLLDERFKKSQILGQISSWARQCLKIMEDYEEFIFKVDLFKKYFQEKLQNQQQADYFFTSAKGSILPASKLLPDQKLVKGSISLSLKSTQKNKNQQSFMDTNKNLKETREKYQKQIQQQKEASQKVKKQKVIFEAIKNKRLPVVVKQCPVCNYERRMIRNTECIHELCEDCWGIWLKQDLRCPICRIRVRQKYLIRN